MTRYQSDVLWLGLILVALNIIINIKSIKSVIFSGPKASPSSGGSNSGGGGGGGLNLPLPPIPGLPLIPLPGLPGLPNPINLLSQQQPTPPGTMV